MGSKNFATEQPIMPNDDIAGQNLDFPLTRGFCTFAV